MPAPSEAFYSVAALTAAHEELIALIDADASPGYVAIYDEADTLLGQVPLDDPCGTVTAETGQLVLAFSGPDDSADAAGFASYATVCDGAGTVHLTLPVLVGNEAVAGYLVMNSNTIFATAPIVILTATVG